MALTDKLAAIGDAIRAQSGKTEKLSLDQMPTEIANLQSINFSVVGNPKPTSPEENAIWVDTDSAITGWVFSAVEPETPTEGLVWVRTGAKSNIVFNALKENSIQVVPLSASQYISGAWVKKTAQIYQNSAWAEWWNGVLYENGDQYTTITGGWVKGYSYGNAGTTATIDDTGIKLSTVSGSQITVETVNKVDLSSYSTLHAKATVTSRTSSSANYLWLACTESSGMALVDNSNIPTKTSTKITALGEFELSLDVSAVDGEYFVAFGASVGGMGVTVNKIWLE